jgi:hypothetical protein
MTGWRMGLLTLCAGVVFVLPEKLEHGPAWFFTFGVMLTLLGEMVVIEFVKAIRRGEEVMTTDERRCESCNAPARLSRYCGAVVCEECDHHNGLARCYCGWSTSGTSGVVELEEMGEIIDGEWMDVEEGGDDETRW